MLQMMACGLKHPITAATFGALYVLGRVIYGYGYSKGGPEGRMAGERKGNASMREDRGGDAFFSLSLSFSLSGGLITHLGDWPLMFMCCELGSGMHSRRALVSHI